MRLLLFGGTTEGRLLANRLFENGFDVLVCVATDAGKEALKDYKGRVHVGRLDEAQIRKLLSDFDCVADATHPYAEEVTAVLKRLCEENNVPYYRLMREGSGGSLPLFEDCEKVCAYLQKTKGNILLTTGTKELALFSSLDPKRLFVRILPDAEGIHLCRSMGLSRRNIIAMYPPHTKEMNIATIRQYGIKYVVTKDGGKAGGFSEKAEAAGECGAILCVIRRPVDHGLTMEELWNELQKKQSR